MGCDNRPITLPMVFPLPAAYDDSLSFYEVVCSLIDKVNKVISSNETNMKAIEDALNELYEYVHGTAWESVICQWVNANLPCIVSQVCKWFWFGINDNGNVVCVIPTSWNNMSVTWNMDFGSADFGRPTIEWE